jgi:hypothetical protein
MFLTEQAPIHEVLDLLSIMLDAGTVDPWVLDWSTVIVLKIRRGGQGGQRGVRTVLP